MSHFTKHYTREEARQLLPLIEQWLDELALLRDQIRASDEQIAAKMGLGDDLGGNLVNQQAKAMADLKQVLARFQNRQIQIKDPDRGLIDFPAYVGGKEVFLCWERGEEDIEFWHDLTSGYAGRERL